MPKIILTSKQKAVIKVLLEHNYILTTREVAKLADISWNTAHKHLHTLHERNWIDKRDRGNRELWKANYDRKEPETFSEKATLSLDSRDQYFVRFPKTIAEALSLENVRELEFVVKEDELIKVNLIRTPCQE